MQDADWFEESDWLASENPHHLLAILARQGVLSPRKHRLVSVGFCRAVWSGLTPELRSVVEAAGEFADRRRPYAGIRELIERSKPALAGSVPVFLRPDRLTEAALSTVHREARQGAQRTAYALLGCAWGGPKLPPMPGREEGCERLARELADVVRDVFGNPFRAVRVPSAHLADEVRGLARRIYDADAYDRLPELAKKLEAAGCGEPALLGHCRSGESHVRGCWAIDLILRWR